MLTILNKRGIYAPVFLCDVCGKEITERDGMVKFSWEGGPPFFCHKITCDRAQDDEERLLRHDLGVVLVWLVGNTRIDWKDAKARADWLAMV